MERIKSLNRYQQGLLIFMAVMVLIFAAVYLKTLSRVGYRYQDAILVPAEENGNTVYSGKIEGKQAQFIVSGDHTVVLHYGDKTYGPYTIKEDVSAIPKEHEMRGNMTGIEVREGDEILFRGGVMDLGSFYWLYSEDGTSDSMIGISYVAGDGIERDADGNPIDRMKPTVSTIYALTNSPELEHKGEGLAWFGAALICFFNAVSILFAEELFLFHLSFQIRNAEYAEPSDLEIAGRYIGWTAMAILAFVLLIMGLQ